MAEGKIGEYLKYARRKDQKKVEKERDMKGRDGASGKESERAWEENLYRGQETLTRESGKNNFIVSSKQIKIYYNQV